MCSSIFLLFSRSLLILTEPGPTWCQGKNSYSIDEHFFFVVVYLSAAQAILQPGFLVAKYKSLLIRSMWCYNENIIEPVVLHTDFSVFIYVCTITNIVQDIKISWTLHSQTCYIWSSGKWQSLHLFATFTLTMITGKAWFASWVL